MLVGNDVVDLRDPRCVGKWRDERFLARILTGAEASAVRASSDPDVALWLAWAGKETAYKIASKQVSDPLPFHHDRYEVEVPLLPGRIGDEPAIVRTSVATDVLRVRLEVEVRSTRIHAVGWQEDGAHWHETADPPGLTSAVRSIRHDWSGDPASWRESLQERFSNRELKAIHRAESALVRLWAKEDAARHLDAQPHELEIVCPRGVAGRSPPVLLLRGAPAPLDISLSHHGDLVAWVMAPA